MSQTVSNAVRTIVTKGTGHVAIALAPDICIVPPNTPTPFPNFVKSDKLQNGTTKTFIAGQPVWTTKGQLGPVSEPAHPGVKGGVQSSTYRQEAKATSYSKDVFLEGNPAVRAFDSTTQNHGNTIGIVIPGALFAYLNAMNGFDGYCLAEAAQMFLPFLIANGTL